MYPTLQDLIDEGTVRPEPVSTYFQRSLRLPVDWRGDGWYSLDAENVLRPDKFPTTHRIRLQG